MTIESSWMTDVRVQARHIKKGDLDPKELEKMLKELPDSEAKCEPATVAQPALTEPEDDEDDEG